MYSLCNGRCFPVLFIASLVFPQMGRARKQMGAISSWRQGYYILKSKKFHSEEICHKFQNPSVNFKMRVVAMITQRSSGIVIFFHTTESFSWFFSSYRLSKSSWKTSVVPPRSKHEVQFHSSLDKKPGTTQLWSEQRGLPSSKQLWKGQAAVGGKEQLGLERESPSALWRQARATTWFPLQPRSSETRPLRHPGGERSTGPLRWEPRDCSQHITVTETSVPNSFLRNCCENLQCSIAFRISHFSA